ncbi:two component transcriptional regulator, LuxR family protein [Vibrio mediterranei AK1]|jgi:DNA-binding NarL/FixJ family response regulator|uniref:response regulator n=1 Tax=Vibrio TaxID=662 RepID=UPI0001540EE8|nr:MULTISPECIES: response regulator transcription factor [Vibrio]EDL54135.1 two component transcriptional regulator, LuxR family protein [Vibrio mediterranei AK1]MCF4176604.1 response regulator transcription factor [Vibrio sp. McD22-P3]
MATVVIADDHQIVSEGIARLVELSHQVVGIGVDAHELVQLVKKHQPDLVITDISMPGMQLNTTISLIKRAAPNSAIVCLSMHDEPEIVKAAFEYGANGYVLKHQAGFELAKTMEKVLAGESYVPDELQTIIEQKTQLTARQLDILKFLAQGLSAKKVALELNISSKTVEYHKYKMMEQLDLKSASELIAWAHSRNLV